MGTSPPSPFWCGSTTCKAKPAAAAEAVDGNGEGAVGPGLDDHPLDEHLACGRAGERRGDYVDLRQSKRTPARGEPEPPQSHGG